MVRRRTTKGAQKGAGLTATALGVAHYQDGWILDSGATAHMTGRISAFKTLEPFDDTVVIGNGAHLQVRGKGEIW